MSIATTFTDVANLALKSIGHTTIQSIDASDSTSRLIRNYIDEVSRQVQLEIHWPELSRVIYPTKLEEPFLGTENINRYQLPEDFLQIIELDTSCYYEIFNGAIVTEATDPRLIYKAYSNNVVEWSGELVELVYKKLAAEISMPLTQNVQLVQLSEQKYQQRRQIVMAMMKNRSRKERKSPRNLSYVTAREQLSRRYPFKGQRR